MAKEPYDPEKVARALFRKEIPKKIGMVAFLEITGVLMNWVRSADRRAKRAEEKLREMPNWQSKHHDMSQLYRSALGALKVAGAEVKALQGRQSEYDAELARWREESEKQYDDFNRQLNKKDDEIKHLTAAFAAALESRKRQGDFAMALVEAAQADIKLAAIVGIDAFADMNAPQA